MKVIVENQSFSLSAFLLLLEEKIDSNSNAAPLLKYMGIKEFKFAVINSLNISLLKIIKYIIDKDLYSAIIDYDDKGNTALQYACWYGNRDVASLLLTTEIDIDNKNIDRYCPKEFYEVVDDQMITSVYEDCRPLVLSEVTNRAMRVRFDNVVHHYIWNQRSIELIYDQCYGRNTIISKPPNGWEMAYEILDKYYLDEVYYHLYLHLKKLGNENLGISKMKDELLRVIMFHLRDMLKPRVSSRNYIRSRYRILINDDDNDEDDNIF